MRILVLVKLQLVTGLRLRLVDHTCGQLQNRVCPQTKRDAPFRHVLPGLEDYALLAEKDHIDGELHRKGVDPFAGNNPKSLSFRQAGVLEQTSPSLLASVGGFGPIGQDRPARNVADTQYQLSLLQHRSQCESCIAYETFNG
jgi:hypothetical protein